MLDDLDAMEDNVYKKPLKQKIDKMLGSFTINMDPSNYRRLYRDKAFREAINLPSAADRQTSVPLNLGNAPNANSNSMLAQIQGTKGGH